VLFRSLLVKKDVLMPIVVTLCVIGAYAVNHSLFDVYVTLVFGVMGYILRNNGYPLAPFTLGLILGRMADENLRRALTLNSSIVPFFTRPICIVLWLLIIIMIIGRKRMGGVANVQS